MQKLEFVVAGVQKAGTTALFEYLKMHPALAAPKRKELHFFDDDHVDWAAPDYDNLHCCYTMEGIRFEVTPIYLFWPGSVQRIRAYRPDMRLIFVFRDPIERAYSHWCMEYARENETLSFQHSIREGRGRLSAAEGRPAALRTWSYVERGFYGQQVTNLLRSFPLGQTLFLNWHDLRLFPNRTLNQLTEFLEIERFPQLHHIRLNQRKAHNYPSILEDNDIGMLRELYRTDLTHFASITGVDVSSWLTMRS